MIERHASSSGVNVVCAISGVKTPEVRAGDMSELKLRPPKLRAFPESLEAVPLRNSRIR
jgi:hypothetical protein